MKRLRWTGATAAVAGALAAFAPALAGANVQVGSSGWQWGNPLPQGNTIRTMSFAGQTGYAAGDFGTLLKTTDGGDTWTGLPAGTFTALSELQTLDANTLVAGGGCVARLSTDGGATFHRIAFTNVESTCPPDSSLAAMWFTTKDVGYIAQASGQVIQTANGGASFAAKIAVPGTKTVGGGASVTDLVFLTDTTGFASTSDGKIFQTTDSANSWKQVNDTNRAVRAMLFVSATTGYAVGDQTLLLKTTDAGVTWKPIDIGAPSVQDLTSIRCASETVCVVTTKAGTLLGVTTDGQKFTFPTPSTDPVFAAAFASPTRLVAAGLQGSTVVSGDAGANFTPIGGRLVGQFSRVVAGRAAGSAFAPGPDGTLAKTLDAGRTWTRGNVTTSQDVLDVSFPTVTDGYALDIAGGLFITNDGGATWKTLDTGSTARPQAVYAPSAKTVMVIGPTGIRRSADSGGSFAAIRGAVARTPLTGADRAGKAIVAYGFQNILRSTDDGTTWTSLRKPGRYVRRGKKRVNFLGIRRADFTDANNGFVLDALGRVWKTRNGGKAWTELTGVGTEAATGMSFASSKKGYLVINHFGDVPRAAGFLLRTDDGGATWHPQFVVADPLAPFGVAADATTDYLLGGNQSLLFSTTGGDAGRASQLTIRAPKARYGKPVSITVTGRLSPASGNERVVVSMRRPGSTRWTAQGATVSANGTFTTSWRLTKGVNLFVAQWQGDFASHGDGSPVLAVTVGKTAK
jgi:photosystem II stability/assembly factor-like uncharacterized protein